MRTAAIGLLVSLALAACGVAGGGGSTAGSPSATLAPSSPTASPTLPPLPLPSPSGEGFCTDRAIIDDVVVLVRGGVRPYRLVAAFITAAGKIVRADSGSAPTDLAGFKMRQLSLVLNTLRLAVRGAVENYPEDFAVRQLTNALPARVRDVSREAGCPA